MLAPLSILLAEDDDALSRVIAELLRLSGHHVVRAADGAEALAAERHEPVDVVVTDVIMPGKDGLEFIQELHERRPALPIVAISGGGTLVQAGYCLVAAKAFGATIILPKPFNGDQLLAAIDRAWAAAQHPFGRS